MEKIHTDTFAEEAKDKAKELIIAAIEQLDKASSETSSWQYYYNVKLRNAAIELLRLKETF